MQVFRAIFVAVVMLTASAPMARAQDLAPHQYETLMRWAGGHQAIIQTSIAPLQEMPAPFVETASREERMAWVTVARQWLVTFRQALIAGRAEAARLGPVPEAGSLTQLYQRQADGVQELFTGMAAFLQQYESGIEAIVSDDPEALHIALVNSVDAQLLIQVQFRNLNAVMAESTQPGPQKHLLRSFASSYDGTSALLRARRAYYVGGDENQSAAAALRHAAASIRDQSAAGRVALVTAEASLPATVPADQSDYLRRVRQALRSFEGSFAREELIAAELDGLAVLLSSGIAFGDLEMQIDPIIVRIGELDFERATDIRRRIALVQQIVPPT